MKINVSQLDLDSFDDIDDDQYEAGKVFTKKLVESDNKSDKKKTNIKHLVQRDKYFQEVKK